MHPSHLPAFDEALAQRLPLPLAALYRRAHNAKAPLERHHAAFYLWEAALKLLGSVAVVVFVEHPSDDEQLLERLQSLARPSLGHWWEFVRRLLPILADGGDAAFVSLRDLLLGRSRDDLPYAAGLDAVLVEVLDGKGGGRATVRLSELFDRLVRYRNREIGHGATGQQSTAFYERLGRALLAGVGELLSKMDVLAGRRLHYVAEVRRRGDGSWLVERGDLSREMYRRLESAVVAEGADLPRPEQLYLSLPDSDRTPALHPLLVFDPDDNDVLFLNGRRGRRRVEYLSYATGRIEERDSLAGEQRELLRRVLSVESDATPIALETEENRTEEPLDTTRALGDFERLSELGRGGMGVVYRAWQPSLGRQVALKCLYRSGDPKSEARFRREIHALGRVEHPHLVKIFTSGADGDQWFYAMELIEGATLASVCEHLQTRGSSAGDLDLPTWRETVSTACAEARRAETPVTPTPAGSVAVTNTLPAAPPAEPVQLGAGVPGSRGYVRHVVELMKQVTEATQALHERGIIHRDVKPGNIMVSADGSSACLMDLGLAQLADEVEGRLTRTRQFVGTLRYASPEQVLAVGRLEPASDVYSLGATLWELLTLRPLYAAPEGTPDVELMRRIQYEEPERLRKYNRSIPRDLEAIVGKCLQKDPRRRYPTARELARDLGDFLQGKPVKARPVSRVERAWKWAKRRPAVAALLALGSVTVVSLLIGGLWYHRAGEQQEIATEMRRLRGLADEQRTAAEHQRDEADKQRTRATEGEALARHYLYMAHLNLAQRTWQTSHLLIMLELLEKYRVAAPAEDLRSFEWHYLWRLNHSELYCSPPQEEIIERVAFSPQGDRLAWVSRNHTVTLCDPTSGEKGTVLKDAAFALAYSPDGKLLATGGPDSKVLVWDTATNTVAFTLELRNGVNALAFSPDGKHLATSSDGKFTDLEHLEGVVTVWDMTWHEAVETISVQTFKVTSLAYSPDGQRLAGSIWENHVRVWDSATGRELLNLEGHTDIVESVAYSPDGRRLASGSHDNRVKVWDANSGQELLTFKGHDDQVQQVAFSPDGRSLASASWDKTVQVHDAVTGAEILTLRQTNKATCVAFSPDGRRLASSSFDRTVKVWDATTAPEALTIQGLIGESKVAAVSPDGTLLANDSRKWVDEKRSYEDREITVWNIARRQRVHTFKVIGLPEYLAFSPDGQRLAVGWGVAFRQGGVQVWDLRTGKEVFHGAGHNTSIGCLAFSPDGRRLASCAGALFTVSDKPCEVKVWDVAAGKELVTFHGHRGQIMSVAFSPDGERLASCSETEEKLDERHVKRTREIKVWKLDSGAELATLNGHTDTITTLAFSPDGKWLASGSLDTTVVLWDTATWRAVRTLKGHSHWVRSVAFTPDSRRLASGSTDHTIKVWDVASGWELLTLTGHTEAVERLTFGPEGRWLCSLSDDRTLKFWFADAPPLENPSYRDTLRQRGVAWNQVQAAEAEGNAQWFAAIFHLSYLLETAADDTNLYKRRAHAYYELDNWSHCIEDSTRVIAAVAADESVWFERGYSQAALEKWDLAVADYSRAVNLAPKNWQNWYFRGVSQTQAGRWELAVADLSRAVELKPDAWRVRYWLGLAHAGQGQWDKAVGDFSEAVDRGGMNETTLLKKALAHLGAKDLEGYRKTCAALLELYGRSNNVSTANNVAWACSLAPKAVADTAWPVGLAEQAVANTPDLFVYRNTLGAALYRDGKFEQAIERLNQSIALQKDGGSAWDWLFLAMAHHRRGRTEESKKYLERAVRWIDAAAQQRPPGGQATAWSQALELLLLRGEAEALIQGESPAPEK